MSVQGMDVNDINFRGDFVLNIVEETKIVWRYTELSFEDLDVGDKIAVTFLVMSWRAPCPNYTSRTDSIIRRRNLKMK